MVANGFIDFLQNYLIQTFSFVCFILFLYGGIIYTRSITLFYKWHNKFEKLNNKEDSLTEEELTDFELEASEDHFINLISSRIKEISIRARELSVDEIKELVDEKIYNYENNLTGVANAFIIVGVLFTVLGLFTGLVGLEEDFNATAVGNLLGKLRLSFVTTIWGIVFSGTTAFFVKFTLSPLREKFSYHLILFAKNVLVPKYGVPDAEKDLGIIVKSISKASKDLQNASLSVQNMAENSQVGTKQIQNAVRGFKEITAKMIEREDQLTNNMYNISNRLTDLKTSIDEMIRPSIDQLQATIDKRELSISEHLEILMNVQEKQSQINTDIRSSMEKVTIILSDLSQFFNRDFEGSFKDAVDSINKRYKHRFDEIFTSIQSMNEKIGSSVSTDQMTSMINNLKEEVTSVTADLSDRMAVMNEKSSTIFEQLQDLVKNLSMMSASFNDEILKLVQSITDYKENVENVSKDINGLNNRIEDFQISDIQELKVVEEDLKNISKQLQNLDDRQADFTKEIKRIKKEAPKEGGVLSGIRSFFSDSTKSDNKK